MSASTNPNPFDAMPESDRLLLAEALQRLREIKQSAFDQASQAPFGQSLRAADFGIVDIDRLINQAQGEDEVAEDLPRDRSMAG